MKVVYSLCPKISFVFVGTGRHRLFSVQLVDSQLYDGQTWLCMEEVTNWLVSDRDNAHNGRNITPKSEYFLPQRL